MYNTHKVTSINRRKKNIIKPSKPVLHKSPFEFKILLKDNQVNYFNLQSKNELEGFRKQSHRHITIIGYDSSVKIENALTKFSINERKNIIALIKKNLKNLNWEFYQKEVYLVEKKSYFFNKNVLEYRKSYISLIEMPDIKIFYNKLNTLLQTHIEMQIPHITLYTKGEHPDRGYFGIGISSNNVFKKLHPKKIDLK